jgi:hypothetical protein
MAVRRRRVLQMLCALIVIVLAGGCTAAASPTGRDASSQVVYWPLVTDGVEYRRIPYPREAGEMRVLADTPVVFDLRAARVSFWPITREYISDFAPAGEFVTGTLEILDSRGELTELTPEPYVEWRPDGVGRTGVEILVGAEAVRRYESHVEESNAAARALQEYSRRTAEQQAAAEAWLRQRAEDPDGEPPPPPEFEELKPPEPYRSYATEPREAFVGSLSEGRYRVRLRGDDGEIVEGTERVLISFGPLARGTGYVLIPEDRWTQPLANHDPAQTVYMTGATDVYFSPVPVEQYNANLFARLFRPQLLEAPDPSATTWVPRDRADDRAVQLVLWREGELVEAVPEIAYRVSQIPRATRGYVIEKLDEDESSLDPDFRAMRLGATPAGITHVSLREDSGQDLPGSVRNVQRFRLQHDAFLFLPALVPLLLALTVHGSPRRR